MNEDVKYSGFAAVPADYECPDGQLATAINCIPENGALQPILPPRLKFGLSQGEKIIYIHKVPGQTNYIVLQTGKDGSSLWWFKDADDFKEDPRHMSFITSVADEISSIDAIGNTIAFSSGEVKYILWKDGNYVFLGPRPPFVTLEFALIGGHELTIPETYDIPGACSPLHKRSMPSDADKALFADKVYSLINSIAAERINSKGVFWQPFFVRYAYRLFDGSHAWQSPPVLMLTRLIPPIVKYHDGLTSDPGKDSTIQATLTAVIPTYNLFSRALPDGIDRLENWQDVIAGIDVFISAPIYTYDPTQKLSRPLTTIKGLISKTVLAGQDASRTEATDSSDDSGYRPGQGGGGSGGNVRPGSGGTTSDVDGVFDGHFGINDSLVEDHFLKATEDTDVVNIPVNPQFHKKIRDTYLFYKVAHISMSDLTSDSVSYFKRLKLDSEDLTTLVAQPQLSDDYASHCKIAAEQMYAFNSRLNLAGIKLWPASPFPIRAAMPFSNYAASDDSDATVYTMKVWTRKNGLRCYGLRIATADSEADRFHFPAGNFPRYIYYPDASAYKMEIKISDTESYVFDLKPHDFLNGAYYYNPRLPADPRPAQVEPETADCSPAVMLPNRIYVSDVNDPFIFRPGNVVSLGNNARIFGLSSAAKALSQGQFGQFPLYAFTNEGVWSIEVNTTGTYSARQPITRDVCINADGITQLDSAVLFPTDRGIMLISGSQTQCISEPLNSEYPFNALDLPGFPKLHAVIHDGNDTCLPILPFTQFLKDCRIIYDYVHQRVIVYAPGVTYAYVYSMKSQQWGVTFSSIVSHLNSYPEALAVDKDNNIVNFSESDAEQVGCLYVTRPLKLGQGSMLKTIDTIIQRGNFARGHVATVLYGSRDLINWHLVWSSKDHYLRGFRGTPYKFFRIAGVANLNANENIIGASVQFTPRLTNQPR